MVIKISHNIENFFAEGVTVSRKSVAKFILKLQHLGKLTQLNY